MGADLEGKPASGIAAYAILACGLTWALATPAALAWMHHAAPSSLAVGCAGLSAFGPLYAALLVAGPKHQLGQVFGRWRTNPLWILAALATPCAVHLCATAIFVAIGGHPDSWFHLPTGPEQVAALIVFPLGEEFGWRGFLHPRAAARYGLVWGSLLVGLVWGVWHLAYAITPTAGGFDPVELAIALAELPPYALIIAWLFERANRSMAVALAVHAGAHLDHFERAPRTDLRLYVIHVAVAWVLAAFAAWALARMDARRAHS